MLHDRCLPEQQTERENHRFVGLKGSAQRVEQQDGRVPGAPKEHAGPFNVNVANKMPAEIHQDCRKLIDRLIGKIKRWDKPMQ